MILKNYSPTNDNFWTGRVDDLHDVDSFRMHQIIKLLDLKDIETLKVDPAKLDICMIGYCCDEGSGETGIYKGYGRHDACRHEGCSSRT